MYLSPPQVHQEALQVVPRFLQVQLGLLEASSGAVQGRGRDLCKKPYKAGLWRASSGTHPGTLSPLAQEPSSAPIPAPHLSQHAGVPLHGPWPAPPASLAALSSDLPGYHKFIRGCLGSWLTLITLTVPALLSCFEHSRTVPMLVRALSGQPGVALSSHPSAEQPALAASWRAQPACKSQQ